MSPSLPLIRCGFGLGNRVAAMANGLSRHPDGIRFAWRINEHLPLPWLYVFPDGLPGVHMETDEPFGSCTRWGDRSSIEWDAAADRALANAAYSKIIAAMAGEAMANPPALAICGRFHRNPTAHPQDLSATAIREATRLMEDRVFVFSDLHRDEISAALTAAGIQPVQPTCQPLVDDMQRSPVDLLRYLGDLKTLLAAKTIIAADGPASALHPARAAGKTIIYASGACS